MAEPHLFRCSCGTRYVHFGELSNKYIYATEGTQQETLGSDIDADGEDGTLDGEEKGNAYSSMREEKRGKVVTRGVLTGKGISAWRSTRDC